MIKLDIFHDPICPWCFLGKARLERALEARPEHPFVLEWHPFQLNPEMPREGADRRAYLEAKFGGPEGLERASQPLLEAFAAELPKADPRRPARVPNTLDAHRLVHWAGIEGAQTPMVSALHRAYFVDGRDIGEADVLADLADGVGMDAAVVRRLLATEEDAELIRARDAHARERGVNAVPLFVVDNLHAVSGAQPADLWISVIDELAARAEAEQA